MGMSLRPTVRVLALGLAVLLWPAGGAESPRAQTEAETKARAAAAREFFKAGIELFLENDLNSSSGDCSSGDIILMISVPTVPGTSRSSGDIILNCRSFGDIIRN